MRSVPNEVCPRWSAGQQFAGKNALQVGNEEIIMIKSLSFWIFVLPAFFVLSLVVLIPFGMGIYYSFTSWTGVGSNVTYVGFANFSRLLSDVPARESLVFTFRFTFTVVILSNVIGLILALGLVEPIRFSGPLRVVFFLPNVIGGLILGFIWRFIFIQGLPAIGRVTGIGLFQIPWLGDGVTGFWGLVIVFVWRTAGYLTVIYVAALLSVDKGLSESAQIDGANYLQRLFHIQIPMIMPAFTVCIFLMLSWAFRVFDIVFSLTNGGPFRSTEVFALNIYNEAFVFNNFGYGSAKAVVFFIIVAFMTLIQVKITKGKEIAL